MTTKEQALEYLRGPATLEAQDAVKDIQPWVLTHNVLTIAQDTHLKSVITRQNKDVILTNCAANMALKQPATKGVSRFDATIRACHRISIRKVLNRLSVLLQIQPGQHHHPVYHDPKIQEAANQAAWAAQPTTLPYTLEDPGTAGYQTLHNFLGRDKVNRTLHLFGEHATLKNFKSYVDHEQILEKSARSHPNAVLLWGTLSTGQQNPGQQRYSDITTNDIINAARKHFIHYSTYRGFTKTLPKGSKTNNQLHQQDIADALWNIFLNLPTEALRRVRLDNPNHYHIHLCNRVMEAGRIPSCETTLVLLENPYVLYSAMPALIHSFIQNSPTKGYPLTSPQPVPRTPYNTQQLAEQLRIVHSLVQTGKKNLKKTNTTNNVLRLLTEDTDHFNDTAPAWAKLMDTAAQDIKDLTKPSGKRTPTIPRPKGKSPNVMDIDFLMRTPPGDDLVLMATEVPTWDADPGHRLTLFTDNPETPLLIIEKTAEGTIITHSDQPLVNQPELPLPRQTGRRPQPSGRNNLRCLLKLDHNEIMAIPALQYVVSTWQHIRHHPDLYQPNINQIAWAVNSYINSPDNGYRYSQDPMGITKTITNALTAMTEPHTLAATAHHVNSVTTYHYNAFRTLGPSMQELCRTNPGAVAWALNHACSTEPLNHPGQLVTLARNSMTKAGIEPRNWKYIAKLDHPIIRDTSFGYVHRLVTLLNAMATSGTMLPQDTPKVLMDTIITSAHRRSVYTDKNEENPKQLLATNLTTMLALLCQQDSIKHPCHPDFSEVMDQAMDVLDYIVDLTQNGDHVRSTTWKGLSKASHHWHRDVRQEQILQEWEETLAGRRKKAASWQSLIGPTTKGEFQILPLENEYQLFQESKDMNHCVVGYAHQCAAGDRIFSVQRNGIKVATSQIRQTDHGWEKVQTRGRDNHPVSEDIKDAMREIAQDYDKVHQAEEQRLREEGTLPAPKNKRRRRTPVHQ